MLAACCWGKVIAATADWVAFVLRYFWKANHYTTLIDLEGLAVSIVAVSFAAALIVRAHEAALLVALYVLLRRVVHRILERRDWISIGVPTGHQDLPTVDRSRLTFLLLIRR